MTATRRATANRLGILSRLRSEEAGATSVIVVLLMTVLMVSAALVVDVGAIQARKAQLQDAADAAALAIAQECFEHPSSTFSGCASAVVADANATAAELAVANLNDGDVTVLEVSFPTADTARVVLESAQQGYFGQLLDVATTDLQAAATARWNPPAVPLALALASCVFPDPGDETVVQVSLAVPNAVGLLLGPECGLLSSSNLVSNTTGTLGLVAGGWLTSTDPILGLTAGSCEYDPNLLTTLSATISKVAPTSCAQEVASWNVSSTSPQRVLLPVFDSGLEQLVVDDVLGVGTIDRYAVLDVSGYSFTGLLGLSNVAGSDPTLCTSVDGVLGEELQDTLGGLSALVLALLGGLSGVLGDATGCQALEGEFIGFVTSDEAAAMTSGVRLIA
jgi:hypothetical protein